MKYFSGKQKLDTEKYLARIGRLKRPYYWRVGGTRIIVHPRVFSPKDFHDPSFFYRKLPIRPGEQWLEIGSGTGILSIVAAKKGAHVTAVDINPAAVRNTKANVKLHRLGAAIRVLQSNVYSALGTKRFDTIFWNTPWGRVRKKKLSPLETALWDTEYKSTERFIAGAKKHLRKNGRLLIGFSSSIGDLPELRRLLHKHGFQDRTVSRYRSRSVNFAARFEIIEAHLSENK